jgi:hypothetical protein
VSNSPTQCTTVHKLGLEFDDVSVQAAQLLR